MEQEENTNKPLKRSDFLTVLCVLSFIGGGMTLLSNAFLYAFHDAVKTIIAEQNTKAFFGANIDFEALLSISPSFFLFQALFSAMSVAGVILIWKLNKKGFHIYTIAQIILLIIPKLYFTGLPFPWFELSISLFFIYFYGKSLRIIK